MTDHKFTDEELEKTLHICSHYAGNCSDFCPLRYDDECVQTMAKHALARINRQKAESERLKKIGDDKTSEVLRHDASIRELHKQLETAKSETIKEFAERVKAIFECDLCFDADVKGYIFNQIDDILKEMDGGKNE